MINSDINSGISLAWNEIECPTPTPFGANVQPRFNRMALSVSREQVIEKHRVLRLSCLTDLVSIYHRSNKATSHNVIAFKLMNVNTG
ncbi:MAG: hypothetical protein ACI8Z1_001301 [Candidatus Azotimanducaceae bacterium]|jgi:hypothetical protein